MQCAFEMQGKSAALKEKPTEQIEKKKRISVRAIFYSDVASLGVTSLIRIV